MIIIFNIVHFFLSYTPLLQKLSLYSLSPQEQNTTQPSSSSLPYLSFAIHSFFITNWILPSVTTFNPDECLILVTLCDQTPIMSPSLSCINTGIPI